MWPTDGTQALDRSARMFTSGEGSFAFRRSLVFGPKA